MTKKVFFPNLDGWRFAAFLAVFYHHSFSTKFEWIKSDDIYLFVKATTRGGNLGVDFFFVLSGFLIIYLLINEKNLTGKIDAKKFYIRRVLRIFPLYYFCVFFGFIAYPVIKHLLGISSSETAHPLSYLLFFANIDTYQNGVLPDSGLLNVLWSISIEEQFYLTIPIILLFIPVRFYRWVFAGVIVTSWLLRSLHLNDGLFMLVHTFAFMGNLAIGGLIAYYSIMSTRFVTFIEELNPWIIRGVYVLVVVIFFFRQEIFAFPVLRVFDTSIIACLFALIILEQNYAKRSDFKMKHNRVFSTWGKYTYGLYCLHMIAAVIVLQITGRLGMNTHLWQVIFLETPAMFLASLGLAYLSYRFYETPFLNLKNRFAVFTENRSG